MTMTPLAERDAVATTRRTAWALTGALAASSWVALVAWDASPYGRFLEHDAGDALSAPLGAAVFVAGWALMLGAMMLPTTAPLVGLFAVVVGERQDRRRLVGSLLGGYLAVWTAAGLAGFLGDRVLHWADHRWELVGDRTWLLTAAALALASAYQLTSVKQRCLTACRSPYGVLLSRWRGRAPMTEAYRIGLDHGRTCVGCCWALMAVMFGVGAGSFAWMLVLAAVMTVEKTARRGASISRPLGVVLGAAAVAVVVSNI